MKSKNPVSGESLPVDEQDFSFVLGGPLFRFFKWARLSDDELGLLYRRIIVLVLFLWVPLLILSALDGHLLSRNSFMPFLLDMDVHVRLLLVVPLLIFAELIVHRRMRFMEKQFRERDLIPESSMTRFNAIISSILRLRNSILAEVLIIVFVYVVGVLIIWRHYTAFTTATWYSVSSAEGSKLSPAGIWYGYVSLPIFQFILLRWYFRLFIWIRFLWQVSRIKLKLIPMHPDRVAGLGFLSAMVYSFIPLVIAHGAMLTGQIGNRIFFLGATLLQYKFEICAMVIIMLFVVLVPLMVFSAQLIRAKLMGKLEYGTLAQRYVREFDFKWLRGNAPAGEQFIGSGDIQSLADMGNSYEIVRSMNIIPFTKELIFQIVLATIAPIIPLILTMMPIEELLKKLAGIIFR